MPWRPVPEASELGSVYVLHFDSPVGHARHYTGWARNLRGRIRHHRAGTGARLTQVARERGIGFRIAYVLPNATREQRLATIFNRLHRMTNEGGSVPEEWRLEGVADRVHTFGTAVLGLTFECCRCHAPKKEAKYKNIFIECCYCLARKWLYFIDVIRNSDSRY